MSVHQKTILYKSLIYGGAVMILAIMQTAFFSRFPLFGATPDLMLAAVLAVAMFEGERAGCAIGIGAGYFIEAIGGVGLSILPLFYMICGAVCGLLCRRAFSRGFVTFVVFSLAAYAAHALVTLIYMSYIWGSFNLLDAFSGIIIPEYFSGVIFSFLPFIVIRLLAKIFHRSRELDR